MELKMQGRDIWVKTTPGPDKGGKTAKPWVSYHRVYDIGLFMTSQEKAAAKVGAKVEQVMEPKK